ncbi:hypothetical protein CISG_00042 [Coccidioides immitis RMSCC 3703]|uniref:Uncharacterized protein n=1 Tax=Coccidioides immitis RMSCC 3703 TaxID=454286 RepID=A0A0J8TDZ3_COCIT|nr:hypothetical protein CISG_00042 [Coccidioides immitis RMSCC 3703]
MEYRLYCGYLLGRLPRNVSLGDLQARSSIFLRGEEPRKPPEGRLRCALAKHFLGGEGASARAAQSRKPEDTKGLGAEKPTDRPAVTSTPYRVVKKTSHNSHRRKAKEVADTKCGFWILEEQRFVNTTLRGDNKTLKHGYRLKLKCSEETSPPETELLF